MTEKISLNRQPRHKVSFVTKADTASHELKTRTLEAMVKREQENNQRAEQKKTAHKKTLVRAAVIAAVITLVIVATPMRGYVVSAAENFWNFCSHFFDDQKYQMDTIVINPEYKQTSDTIQKIGSVNKKLEVDGITFDFQDLYYDKELEIDSLKLDSVLNLSVNISRDDSTEYMPVVCQYLEIVAEKDSKIVFTGTICGGTDPEDSKLKNISCSYAVAYINYINFDDFGNSELTDKYEAYLKKRGNKKLWEMHFFEIMDLYHLIKDIQPDTYKIYQIDTEICKVDNGDYENRYDDYNYGYIYHNQADYDKYNNLVTSYDSFDKK